MSVLTGFKDLDRILEGGLQNGFLYVLAARPAMGKTGFALNILDHLCMKDYRSAVMFSLEVSKKQIMERILSLESGVDSTKIRMGDIEDDEWDLLIEGAKAFKGSKMIIDGSSYLRVSQIRESCLRYRKENVDLSVIIVDYVQLMLGSGNYRSRQEEISEIFREFKELAKELDIPIILLSQLPRTTENREDHRPILSDLAEFGNIGKICDVVMFLYRDEYYYLDTDKKGIAEVIVAKNPLGSCGVCELNYSRNTIRFENKS